jgi:hypothetical protein
MISIKDQAATRAHEALRRFDDLKTKPEEVVLTSYNDPERFGPDASLQAVANDILKRELSQRGVRVEVRKISWDQYQNWLKGRSDTPDHRAKFAALPTRLGLYIHSDLTSPDPRSAIGWCLVTME